MPSSTGDAPPARPLPAPGSGSVDPARALGPSSAPVTIVEFADFQCPFCARAEETLRRLREIYGDRIRLVWKDLPLPFHSEALAAAEAARAAGAQGKFWQMHDLLLQNVPSLGAEGYRQWAAQLGLDPAQFELDRKDPAIERAIRLDASEGSALGVTGTPTFFINGRRLVGAQPLDHFREIIDRELGRPSPVSRVGLPKVAQLLETRAPCAARGDSLASARRKAVAERFRSEMESLYAPALEEGVLEPRRAGEAAP
ncbi:MAG: DsbA family protein [Myxococcales bacterium]